MWSHWIYSPFCSYSPHCRGRDLNEPNNSTVTDRSRTLHQHHREATAMHILASDIISYILFQIHEVAVGKSAAVQVVSALCPVWRVFMAEAGPSPWPGAVDVLMSTFLVTRSRGQGPGGGWGPCSAAGEETETHLARNWVRSAWSEPGPSQHQLLTPSTGASGPFGPCGL